MKAHILLVEGKKIGNPSFVSGLMKKGFEVETVTNGNAALEKLEQNLPHLVLVNAASMRTSGKRICQSIRQQAKGVPVVLVVEAGNGAIDKQDAEVVLILPFTLQKLLNRIRPLLPLEGKDILQLGPLKLDMEQRWVRSGEKQVSLTPRLVNLLKTLMEHPGEVVDRAELFRHVWETEYIGDTRTLDVHVSWLRQALEEDPRHPRFIKTVRGVGYRLDVETFFPPPRRRKK